MKDLTIITPSIGSEFLRDCVYSVEDCLDQTSLDADHLIVADGEQYLCKVWEIVHSAYNHTRTIEGDPHLPKFIKITNTPYNTGSNGFYGHRIYAAYSHLVDSKYIMFLDEDNWYSTNHIKSMVDMMDKNQSFAFGYSLRSIYDKECNFITYDNCESLGIYPISGRHEHLVDTSAYIFRATFLNNVASIWHHGWGGDRRFYNMVRRFDHGCTGQHTLSYRLDGNPNSVTADFFKNGNEISKQIYGEKFPWIIQQQDE